MTESFTPTFDAEVLASINWPDNPLSDNQRIWLTNPLGADREHMPQQIPLEKGIALIMAGEIQDKIQQIYDRAHREKADWEQEAWERNRQPERDELTLQAIEGFLATTQILASPNYTIQFGQRQKRVMDLLQTDPSGAVLCQAMLANRNLALAERSGVTAAINRFGNLHSQIISAKEAAA